LAASPPRAGCANATCRPTRCTRSASSQRWAASSAPASSTSSSTILAQLLAPDRLLSGNGFTFDGGVILAALLIAAYVHRTRLSGRYLDAAPFGLPLGVAIGRIGDVINGEHYGDRSSFLLAVRNSHPDALTPNPDYAYHNGGLYEVLLATIILAAIWPIRHRLTRPGDLAWLVLALFAAGRFFEFFLRADSPHLALGINNAQWTSIALLLVVITGRTITKRRADRHPA